MLGMTTTSRPSLQFSLRAVLILMGCVAFGCAFTFSTPDYVSVPGLFLITFTLPAVLTAGVVYSRENWRAFCIGGLFPCVVALLVMTSAMIDFNNQFAYSMTTRSEWEVLQLQFRFISSITWAMTLLNGLLVVFVRYLLVDKNEPG